MTLPNGTRHRNPHAFGRRAIMVPTNTASERGDWQEGFIDLPVRLCRPPKHSNAWHEQQRALEAATRRWEVWKAKKGWRLVSKPRWTGPFDRPTARAGMAMDEGRKRYYVIARFLRTTPFWLSEDAALYLNDQAMLYDVDIWKAGRPDSPMARGKDLIIDNDPTYHDALKDAEERRQELGLKRQDFQFGPLSEPMRNPYSKPLLNEVKLEE